MNNKWISVSNTRHEYVSDNGRIIGCIILTDLGWLPRVWHGTNVTVMEHRKNELLAKLMVEKNA